MNPNSTTPEGRRELRRLISPHGSPDIQDWAHPALDGLDIAEKAMLALEGMAKAEMYVNPWKRKIREALAAWDKWKGER